MPRILLPLVLLLSGCAVQEGGAFDLQITGVDDDVSDTWSVVWDGGVTWTREVGCVIEGGSNPTYVVDVVDRSQGLEVELRVQSFEGPGDYERDEFQPTPALVIDWSAPETGERRRLGTDSGGRCAILVEEPNRTGTLSCVDVPVFVEEERIDGLASILAAWSCGLVERESTRTSDRYSGRFP